MPLLMGVFRRRRILVLVASMMIAGVERPRRKRKTYVGL